jgi:hypothetical protein
MVSLFLEEEDEANPRCSVFEQDTGVIDWKFCPWGRMEN